MRLPTMPPQLTLLLLRAQARLQRLREDRGASTLEWVVITTLIIGIAIAAAAVMKDKVTEWLAKIP
ncbi:MULTISPECIES: hypothetical protein [Microbispora]|uniref:Uncharacterized protein n=2 Tax=Microbispora TaxID=2005 RepID=A0A1N7GH87_9ACTN|nr:MULTISPECIES: hypothetical protein [Microbispora]MBD3147069.1 hypothetical protein [Microbispora camponoti]GIH51593.1 hypothetical protein Mro03_67720 [Microbispora rosea subsp. rosea]SIS11957.1 hypothetical protein SAMN05421833_1297 [Microbispora rosea]